MNWTRHVNTVGKQLRCGGCGGVIDIDETYWRLQNGCRLCIECGEPDDETTCDL